MIETRKRVPDRRVEPDYDEQRSRAAGRGALAIALAAGRRGCTKREPLRRPALPREPVPAPTRPAPNWHPGPWSVPRELAGTATVAPDSPVVAGSWQSFTVVYTAGRFGIDDSGSIKICFRFATDQTKLQLDHPAAAGFVTVEASNGAVLETRFDLKQNTRPYDRTLHVKVLRGFLREGDTITVRIGDRSGGGPGLRVQTFTEPFFEFRVLADPIACYHYVPVAEQPWVAVVAGARASWQAVLPSLVAAGEAVSLRLRSDDAWGNPTGSGAADLRLTAIGAALEGLPSSLTVGDGEIVGQVDGLVAAGAGEVSIEIGLADGTVLARSNPMRVLDHPPERRIYWADFHAQSGETIGTNAAFDYFAFARDAAFLDVVGHQGNDFQITPEFWAELNRLYDAFDELGRFVAVPGYEWSGNTALGGDRNVFYRTTGRPIRRSSHALVPDHGDIASDCHTARDLFAALAHDKEDVVTFAHVGGRYADIGYAHDPAVETAVEVHSSWGTFEWIAHDAFDLGYRVGIVANSDGHKGRPGAESPGASMFGAYGGLTALLMPELSRGSVFKTLRARRHYATTGSRPFLDLSVRWDGRDAVAFARDPSLGPSAYRPLERASYGEIVHAPTATTATITLDVSCAAPIERVEFRNGRAVVHTCRPYGDADLGRRIRVVWSGAEYRGRARMTPWDGTAVLDGNAFERAQPINFLNRDRPLERRGDGTLSWQSITTGNFSGFDATLRDATAGTLRLDTAQGAIEIPVAEIGIEPRVFAFGGLDRKLQVYRLPDENPHRSWRLEANLPLDRDRDNPLYVSLVTEDGHQAWSSPVYLVPRPDWM